jgi:tetratricopeptide (TPR) repeat protein
VQRIILIILGISFFITVNAQERTDFFYFDSLTFKQYEDGRWKELKESGKMALREGYDYYYLRMRIGISYYEQKDYLTAIKHFKKALEFSDNDQIAIEYLYYCYLLSGKYYTARAYTKLFRPSLYKKTGLNTAKANRLSVDYLYNMSESDDVIDYFLNMSAFTEPGNLFVPVSYSNIGLTMYNDAGPGFNLKHTLSYLSRENSLFTNDGIDSYSDYRQKVNQFQYYISAIIGNTAGLTFSPSLYYIYTSYNLIGFSTGGTRNFAYLIPVKENNIGAGLAINYTAGPTDLYLDAYASRLGSRTHLQAGSGLLVYPLSNNHLYFGAGYYIKISEIDGGYDRSHVFKAMTGISANNKFYIDFTLLSGDLENYIDGSSQLVYNGINEIERVIKADISIPLKDSGVIFYLGSRYTSEYSAFLPADYYYSTASEKRFNSLSFIGGLSWTF